MTSRISKGSGIYTCIICKKQTRETGLGESYEKICAHCYEVGGYINSVMNGEMTIDEVPEEYREDVRKDV